MSKNSFLMTKAIFTLLIAGSGVFKLDAAYHLSARLIVTGPGNLAYSFWGHVGIALENDLTGEDLFYDFGNFSFQKENFYRNFAMGRLLYMVDVKPTELFLSNAPYENRTVKIYPLNLGEEELEELDEILQWSVKPENSEFLYDYFLENCSTKVRDILNTVTDGAFKEASENVLGRNFRYYTRVGTAPSLFLELLLHFLLGPMVDRKISLWDEMFLPEFIPVVGRKLIYKGRDSVERRLLGEPMDFVISSRVPVPIHARILWPGMLLLGLVLGFAWNWLGLDKNRKRRLCLSVRTIIILLVALPGALIFFVSIFTNHVSAHGNINVWPTLPTVIVNLVPLFMKKDREIFMSWIWTINLAGLVAAAFLNMFVQQDAYAFWAFYTPFFLACSRLGLWFFTWVWKNSTKPAIQEGISN